MTKEGDGVRPEPPVERTADDSCNGIVPREFFFGPNPSPGRRIMEYTPCFSVCACRRTVPSGPGGGNHDGNK